MELLFDQVMLRHQLDWE